MIDLAVTTTGVARLLNGVELPYMQHGEPDGTPVIFLHGYSDSMRCYRPILAALPGSLRAIALTQRGHGDASAPAGAYAPADFASDIAQFMDAQEIGSAVIVGHSMGSTVAQQFAIDFPERTSALVLLGSFVDFAGNPAVQELQSAVDSLTEPVDQEFIREFQQSTLAKPVPTDYFEMVVAESAKLTVAVWEAALAGLMETNLTDRLGRITAPTLVLWGEQDLFTTRAEQDLLIERIPNARLSIYEGGGHAFHWEEPARAAAEIAAFVSAHVR